MKPSLQWGGRFTEAPDLELLRFGSSLAEDLILAPFDVRCSLAHVDALEGGGIVDSQRCAALREALVRVGAEVQSGEFEAYARASEAEDIHGAVDARVRELCGEPGDWLHAGRSRNDQVATTLTLYARDRARSAARRALALAKHLHDRAHHELESGTLVAATTHWQPAQPVLLAFWLQAAAEPFVRAAARFAAVAGEAVRACPLGSAAVAGSSLPLDRNASAHTLGFESPSRNAMDSIGTRDPVLDLAHAYARCIVDASRIAAEIVVWATPAFGYVRLGDASSTGSSLMPQKRNPDPFELVRGGAAELLGAYAGAVASLAGLPLSYHRDLQQAKRLCLSAVERGSAMLSAFERALHDVTFVRERMTAQAADGFTVATDLSDALVQCGVSARRAHALVGTAVGNAERQSRALEKSDLDDIAKFAGLTAFVAPLDAPASVNAKRTPGSTHPGAVRAALTSLLQDLEGIEAGL